jgi:hypothetical protein
MTDPPRASPPRKPAQVDRVCQDVLRNTDLHKFRICKPFLINLFCYYIECFRLFRLQYCISSPALPCERSTRHTSARELLRIGFLFSKTNTRIQINHATTSNISNDHYYEYRYSEPISSSCGLDNSNF